MKAPHWLACIRVALLPNNQGGHLPPVIAIDGPTASGKGTVAQRVAAALGWHVLDSGALYRLTALAARNAGIGAGSESSLARVAASLNVVFESNKIFLDGTDVTEHIRHEEIGNLASQIAPYAAVRGALLQRQRQFRVAPGLVADGRDMGTVVFPDAPLKIFLEADVRARAERRCKQLNKKGFSANLPGLIEDMRARDERDRTRVNAPLAAAPDAKTIDSSNMTIDETVNVVLDFWSKTGFLNP